MRNAIQVALFSLALIAFSSPGLSATQQTKKGPAGTEKQPSVLVVYADWCPMCQKLKPVLTLINNKYQGKIRFVRYDITSRGTEAESKQQAQKLGLDRFFAKNRDTTSLVVILDSSGHEVFRTKSDYELQHYETVLDRLLQNGGHGGLN